MGVRNRLPHPTAQDDSLPFFSYQTANWTTQVQSDLFLCWMPVCRSREQVDKDCEQQSEPKAWYSPLTRPGRAPLRHPMSNSKSAVTSCPMPTPRSSRTQSRTRELSPSPPSTSASGVLQHGFPEEELNPLICLRLVIRRAWLFSEGRHNIVVCILLCLDYKLTPPEKLLSKA